MTRSKEKEFWNNVWNDRKELYDYEIEKFKYLLNIIPKDCESIIDIGCGSGNFTNTLVGKYEVVGVDLSESGLVKLKCPSKIGSITDIPAENKSFDMAIAMEILEHLGYDGSFEKALSELERVAKKYILITVPAFDNPISGAARCDACKSVFHLSQHVRFFNNKAEFEKMFFNFRLVLFKPTGTRIKGSPTLRALAMAFSNYTGASYEGLTCLVCRNRIKPISAKKSFFSLIFVGMDMLLCRMKKLLGMTNPHNYVALYERVSK